MNTDTVKVKIRGQVYTGRVVGKKLKFPLVWVRELDKDIEFSWSAINRALSTGSVLKGD